MAGVTAEADLANQSKPVTAATKNLTGDEKHPVAASGSRYRAVVNKQSN